MNIFNKSNTYNTGDLKILSSYMLIGKINTLSKNISMQLSSVPINSEQPIHNHEPEQCYYIINGKGLMIIENEESIMKAGDAVYIPSNKQHGIKNIGTKDLEYLTVNSPIFDVDYENKLWPAEPKSNKVPVQKTIHKKHREQYEVLFYHLDRKGFASIKSINNFIQATVTKHGRVLSANIEDLSEKNLTWVFSRFHIKMKTYPKCFDHVIIDTWRSGSKSCFAFREFDIYDEKENFIGVATASAALIDTKTRKPVEMPEFIKDQFAPDLGRAIQDNFEKLPVLEKPEHEKVFQVRINDIDLNNHVNNTSYMDWIIESLPKEILMDYIILEIEINYLAEVFYGESIISQSSLSKSNDEKTFIHKLIRKEDGRTITLARTVWKKSNCKVPI
jgi:medium-chain acyl-[acyl-carrier-protein] hydrolase